jgi:hypothetical protein
VVIGRCQSLIHILIDCVCWDNIENRQFGDPFG